MHNKITGAENAACFVMLMQESYLFFSLRQYPRHARDRAWLCCMCELQELTFLQLYYFMREDNYVFNKRYQSDLWL
ncbi:hypothetical protein KL86SPO_50662 [uncultured Sporomusa sp.]|uniref:Uncharacterized protein n=1 Tax=uncultured Sporomusa sp. TaxID=307249 RepID=A0A212LZH4_9FIRM|nr:hypothetical protein KL86SPO_50662 [uncultured Sporomusa sp.]